MNEAIEPQNIDSGIEATQLPSVHNAASAGDENCQWIEFNYSPTVFVFVHGILSKSETCWRNLDNRAFWPELVLQDPEFRRPSIFLAGYPADMASGNYTVYDAAEELAARLRARTDNHSPLRKPRILFVCHSQGGLVVRQMLVACSSEFRSKKVGLLLCGSPGWGSVFGTILRPIAFLLGFRQAQALAWGSESLVTLERDFLRIVRKKEIPDLHGKSLVETKGVWGLPKIVSGASAARYFPDWSKIPKTNHFQIVKPDGPGHLSHVYLRDFTINSGFAQQDIQFEPNLGAILEREKLRYKQLKGPFQTPALIRVLLSSEEGLVRCGLRRKEQMWLNQWVNAHERALQNRKAGSYVEFSWREMPTMKRAMELAAEDHAEEVGEIHLWRAILEVPSTTLNQMTQKFGLDTLMELRSRARQPSWVLGATDDLKV